MARARSNGNGQLDQAMKDLAQAQASLDKSMRELSQAQAILVQNQAAFLAHARKTDEAMAESNRVNTERFARIEATLHSLAEAMRGLPDAIHTIRDRFGFKPPEPPKAD